MAYQSCPIIAILIYVHMHKQPVIQQANVFLWGYESWALALKWKPAHKGLVMQGKKPKA